MKVFDEGEWLQSKYNVKAKRKRWRKLHLGLNLVTGDIVCSDLTLDDVGDPTVLPDLLNQIGTPVSRFIADGAYDGAPTSDLLKATIWRGGCNHYSSTEERHSKPAIQVFSLTSRPTYLLKFKLMAAWPGNLAVATISAVELRHRWGRWKAIIGPKLKAPLFRKSANGGQNRRRHSQQNDRTRPTRVQTNLIACITGKGGLRTIV